ncbi:MAG: hydrolase [Gemmatales bacterium]|nr:MAG: hydrolase [Gemmatales bacterium]
MSLTLEQYASYLDTRDDLTWPAPPEPKPAKAKPFLKKLPGIRAVTWNVYGTLLSISGGEFYYEHPQPFVMNLALDKVIQEFNMWSSMTRKAGQPADYLKEIYEEFLENQRMAPGLSKYPEICVEKIWEAILKRLLQKDYEFDAGFYGALNEFSVKLAYFYHSSLQGTCCNPGAAQVLKAVHEAGLEQGLLADGQCFTMVQLQRGLAVQDADLEIDKVLPKEHRVLSHRVGARKPSEKLFHEAMEVFRERGITADRILHIGSRIEEDIMPAKRLGLKTALFAGDSASLKATPEQLKTPHGRPDLLITRLDQLIKVVQHSLEN